MMKYSMLLLLLFFNNVSLAHEECKAFDSILHKLDVGCKVEKNRFFCRRLSMDKLKKNTYEIYFNSSFLTEAKEKKLLDYLKDIQKKRMDFQKQKRIHERKKIRSIQNEKM